MISSQPSEGTLLDAQMASTMTSIMFDEFSRRIISSAVSHGRTVEEICEEQDIPLSTCYRRIKRLVDGGAMIVERIVVASSGRKYAVYRSTFARLEIRLENGRVSAYGTLNPAVADGLRRKHTSSDETDYRPQLRG